MRKQKLIQKVRAGSLKNIPFSDFLHLIQDYGFELSRTQGSHHIFKHPICQELLNLQNAGGEVKPYQVKQFLALIERYHLKPEQTQ